MDKNYSHTDQEEKIYQKWMDSGLFEAKVDKSKKPFTIIMPPPNANDPLHVGHAMFVTIEDILARYHRMRGCSTLWLPGTDHAGIETQFVFEKKLAKEGKSRFDFDRETLYSMIAEYVNENSGISVEQMKRLGASADWSRFKFTLDVDVVNQATDTFIKLYEDGLVYKGVRLVNYCTKCGTGYSELEVEHEEREDKLYFINYGPLTVATTRPETMLGDVAVAVNPKDSRYSSLIGQEIDLPLASRKIKIIGDEMVEMGFGTGAVKITPAHDNADWEMAERQGWDVMKMARDFQVIGQNGKMIEFAGKYAGLSVTAARESVLADLGDKLIETKPLVHNVGTCYRCHRVIEPLPMSQFFIKVRQMADKAIEALDKGEVRVHGAGRDKILRQWLINLKDWNISRQIVWGIQIPVWYSKNSKNQKLEESNGEKEYVVSMTSPGEGWVQETDTFDTWFSSGQWPVITLKTNRPGDFEYFYPTSVMETGYDILPFWVMRMMMLGIYLTGKPPFRDVYLHGLIRDEKGQKMSKSKGNVINPLEMVEKYGADALRMALVMSSTPGQDKAVGESNIRGMRNFSNKIWNATRYVMENSIRQPADQKLEESKHDEEVKNKINKIIRETTLMLDQLRIGLAAETVHNEFWHWFCDELIEKNKKGELSGMTLRETLLKFLKLLHPFVPFVTEAAWKELGEEKLLMGEPWGVV